MLPVCEAVSNAIHAIEDAKIPLQNGEITIEINRDGQALLPYDQASKRSMPDAPLAALAIFRAALPHTLRTTVK
jgi:hypothetical protein